jgi:glycosyltransferase involved in cell wall biosynthesis
LVLVILGGQVKIVHLSTSHTGGAGIAARRLNNLLRSQNIDSLFVTLSKEFYKPDFGEVSINKPIFRKLFGGVVSKFNSSLSKQTYFSLTSISAIDIKKLRKFGDSKNTIFHIHNWFNLLSIRTIKKLLEAGYHLVFTLHDQRLFTGGCHYSLHCEGYVCSCDKCPLLKPTMNMTTGINLRKLKKIIAKYKQQITIIAPSKWILHKAKSSSILSDTDIRHISNIHYGFDVTSKSKNDSSSAIKSPMKFGVATMDKSSTIKGSDLVSNLVQSILVNNLDAEIVYLYDYFKPKVDPLSFWRDTDYLLVLSRADNSPNVIHEAKIRGIPIVGTKVGGITELLNPEYDYLIDVNGREVSQALRITKEILSLKQKPDSRLIKEDYSKFVSGELPKMLNVYYSIFRRADKI